MADDSGERAAQVMDHEREHLVLGVLKLRELLQLLPDERVLRPELQERTHAQQQLEPIDGFGEEVVGARLEPQVLLLLLGQRRHQQHRQERLASPLLDLLADVIAVHSRHHHVEEHEIHLLCLEQVQRRRSVRRFQHAVLAAEHRAQQRPVVILVVDDQDRGAVVRAHSSPARSAWASRSSASSCRARAAR